MNPLKIGVLASGGGTNLQAIIDNAQTGVLKAQIAFVASDNPMAFALERAGRHDIAKIITPYSALIKAWDAGATLPPDDFDLADVLAKESFMANADPKKRERFFVTRAICEADLLRQMEAYDYDLLVLAGFMRTLTPYFIDRVNRQKGAFRILNIHPALLPAFPGRDGYGDTFRYGCKVAGCTVHFVDYGEDSGPIVAQSAFAVEPGDTLETVQEKGLKLEWETYTKAINLYAENKISIVTRDKDDATPKRFITQILP